MRPQTADAAGRTCHTLYNRVMHFSESIFASRFHITRGDLEAYLAEALSQGGDYADLYFEYLLTSSIGIDESMVKSAAQGVSMGVGVRVISGERTGYAYSDDLSPERIRKAAKVAACMVTQQWVFPGQLFRVFSVTVTVKVCPADAALYAMV